MRFSGFEYQLMHVEHQLFFTKLTTPYSQEEILSELKKESWVPFGQTNTVGLDDDHWAKRFKVLRAESPLLQRIQSFIFDQDTRASVVDALYQSSPNIRNIYGMEKDFMIANTLLHGEFTWDRPGFACGRHIDFRLLAATGGTYFTDHDDERLATHFYRDNKSDSPAFARATTEFGSGWMQVNDIDVWHDGWNNSDQDRYSMLTALTLQLKNPAF